MSKVYSKDGEAVAASSRRVRRDGSDPAVLIKNATGSVGFDTRDLVQAKENKMISAHVIPSLYQVQNPLYTPEIVKLDGYS